MKTIAIAVAVLLHWTGSVTRVEATETERAHIVCTYWVTEGGRTVIETAIFFSRDQCPLEIERH